MSVVYEGKSIKGRSILIRYPQKEDLNSMWRYINKLSKERTFIRLQGEEISLKEESEYLDSLLHAVAQKKGISLLLFFEKELIGLAGLKMGEKTERHRGTFHLSVDRNYRGEGIGTLLMSFTIEEAIRYIPDLEIVCLSLFARNFAALHIYKKYGFIEIGRLPRGIKLGEQYDDQIIMYKQLRV